ncbi:DUF4365 domain-containing protein (plasmid) [Sinorhizobium meliloti]|uniref:DUF4365 domain-containing protein n=1 Tax=Rhizobium meliloti TaxID=382 RepID=UPI000B5A408E|nr:DUF4365 domain-containing protein [Sinorhizobium meliloti]MCK3785911.1 DUF4365 domain-containing protein [Sinorhizobium meliloti]MCK3790819.1 DUF4365 domain-containing protein [Sinorhizobium meliloti]MCK3798052.1 DUF4365 domain-containing protein [Sinorhizobium meliloti]MDW9527621.1 DUF4365 domain-containing protein [Sinorhizobium meliloti]MDW9804008.1 DUF4365 domain-containing protein [Sinorhizobium meliloti]
MTQLTFAAGASDGRLAPSFQPFKPASDFLKAAGPLRLLQCPGRSGFQTVGYFVLRIADKKFARRGRHMPSLNILRDHTASTTSSRTSNELSRAPLYLYRRCGASKWEELMELPSRTEQQAAEARSYNILQYKIEHKVGIFRKQTDNDFGIDFDIELEMDKKATGRSIKAQVKSGKELKPRLDGVLTVSGIKQSTLVYWCSISQQTNVIAYAVDLKSETIFVTSNLFWQATQLIDGSEKSKTIEFLPAGDEPDRRALHVTLLHFSKPTVPQIIASHQLALRNLKHTLDLLDDAFHYDAGSNLHEPEHFTDLLNVCKVLLWGMDGQLWTDPDDRRNWSEVDYWDRKAMDDGWGELCYFSVQPVLSILVPALINRLCELREAVLAGKYYWAHNNQKYLKSVYASVLPGDVSVDGLRDWSQADHSSEVDNWTVERFIREAAQANA